MCEIAMQWNDGYDERIESFANNILTPEGGMHETGFRTALTRVINAYGKSRKILKDERHALRRGLPRGSHRRHFRQARQPAV